MSFNHDAFDISVLRSDPDAFILGCQKIIRTNVKLYIASRMFSANDEDDIVQTINEELIKKLQTIATQYKSNARLLTYMSVVIRNTCLQIYKQQEKHLTTTPYPEIPPARHSNPLNDMIITDEVRRLQTIVELYHRKRFKLVLCLKLHFRMPVLERDIRNYFPAITKEDKDMLISTFFTAYDTMSVEDVFETIGPMFTKYDGVTTTWKSIRRWTLDHIGRVIILLNGDPPQRAYNEESLKILFDYYVNFHQDNQ